MGVIHKLKILVMFLSLAAFTVMVILNAANATGIFRGNANKLAVFRGGFLALYDLTIQGALGGADLFVTSLFPQTHLDL